MGTHQNRPNSLAVLAMLAVAVPTLVALQRTPSTTFFNQVAALAAWGLLLLALVPQGSSGRGARAVLAALGLMAAAVYAAVLRNDSLNEFSALVLLAGAAALWSGAARSSPVQRGPLVQGLALGWLVAGVLGAAVGAVQVFAPGWATEPWLAAPSMPGRAVGNLRQPNHLATVLLCGAVGLTLLACQRGWRGRWVAGLMALLVGGVVLTASRAGLWAGVPLLCLWGLLDRQLPGRLRVVLALTPLMAALVWLGMHAWAASGQGVFAAQARLDSEGAGSPSRVKILANAMALLAQEPWAGVGWGSFNRAWTLTPFPDRPIAFFDHTHNLPVQLLVELGWPLGLLVLGLLLVAAGQALRLAWRAQGADATERRSLAMLLVVVGLHSMLEYPLWYAYFLFPSALAWGLLAAVPAGARPPQGQVPGRWRLVAAAAVLLGASVIGPWEYARVAAIYAPGSAGEALDVRVRRGQQTLFLSRHADYAAATALGHDARALAAARQTGHQLIDARLLIAWAKSLHAAGETDKARYLVARLREFRSREGAEWLAVCTQDPARWMCAPPQRTYRWREF